MQHSEKDALWILNFAFLLRGICDTAQNTKNKSTIKLFGRGDVMEPNPTQTKKIMSNHAFTNSQKSKPSLLPQFHHINPSNQKNKKDSIQIRKIIFVQLYTSWISCYLIFNYYVSEDTTTRKPLPIHLSSLSTWGLVGFSSAKSIQSQSLETQLLTYSFSTSFCSSQSGGLFFGGGGGEGRLGKVMRLSQIVNPDERKKLKRC